MTELLDAFNKLRVNNDDNIALFHNSDPEVNLQLVNKLVLEACKETALSFRASTNDRFCRNMVLSLVRAAADKVLLHDRLRRTIKADPALASCRFDSAGTGVPDGFTPLHVAASIGNIITMKVLLNCENSESIGVPYVSSWSVDLQGRTPIHLAVAYGKAEAVRVLFDAMTRERHEPVGFNAPIDLTGNTPLGWAGKELDGKYVPIFMPPLQSNTQHAVTPNTTPIRATAPVNDKSRGHDASTTPLGQLMLRSGDYSILPKSPLVERSGGLPGGLSPLRGVGVGASINAGSKSTDRSSSLISTGAGLNTTTVTNATIEHKILVYGFAEATGWRPYMEDRIISGSMDSFLPLTSTSSSTSTREGQSNSHAHNTFIFGVLDGHGGDYTVNFMKKRLPEVISAQFAANSVHNNSTSDQSLITIMSDSFLLADRELSLVQRMIPQVSTTAAKVSYLDNSGATGCVCLVNDEYICCGNVGDSRAVVGLLRRKSTNDHVTMVGVLSTPTKSSAAVSSRIITAKALSVDHKPQIPLERERIEAAGASVKEVNATTYEVYLPEDSNGSRLRLSRAFGDYYFKQNTSKSAQEQAISPLPEVYIHSRKQTDDDEEVSFLVIACDGIWDVMSNADVISFVYQELCSAYASPMYASQFQDAWDPRLIPSIADKIIQQCIDLQSEDNLSIVIVLLNTPRRILF